MDKKLSGNKMSHGWAYAIILSQATLSYQKAMFVYSITMRPNQKMIANMLASIEKRSSVKRVSEREI